MSRRRRGSVTAVALLAVLVPWLLASRGGFSRSGSIAVASSPSTPLDDSPRTVSDAERADAIARAHVWRSPSVPIHQASLGPSAVQQLSCRFKISELGGTTPKFDCDLETGEEVRIKYGKGPEIPAEAAATRLLSALGFGADHITLIERLRCYGCPEEPFSTMKAVELTRSRPLYERVIDYNDYEDFEWVALERKFPGRPIETENLEGWAVFELDKVDPSKGGAPREHVDALRLMALVLSHWDNKAENQRLVCLTSNWPAKDACPHPFLLLQDVGSTFGPSKVNLDAWEHVPMWQDRATCTISMREFPYDGATFGEVRITEAGREFFEKLLSQLSDQQLRDLFSRARFDQKRGLFSSPRPVAEWIRVFKAKTRAIVDGPPCP